MPISLKKGNTKRSKGDYFETFYLILLISGIFISCSSDKNKQKKGAIKKPAASTSDVSKDSNTSVKEDQDATNKPEAKETREPSENEEKSEENQRDLDQDNLTKTRKSPSSNKNTIESKGNIMDLDEEEEVEGSDTNNVFGKDEPADTNHDIEVKEEEEPSENEIIVKIKKGIDFLSSIPIVGGYVAQLDLETIIDKATEAAAGGSKKDVATAMLQSVINGLKLVPEYANVAEMAEPLVMGAADALLNILDGKSIFGLTQFQTTPPLTKGQKVVLVLDHPKISSRTYQNFLNIDEFSHENTTYITEYELNDIDFLSKIDSLKKLGIQENDIFFLYLDHNKTPTMARFK